MLLDTLVSTLGVTLLNIDDSPIKLTGLKLTNCFDTVPEISDKILQHYKH